MGTDCFLCKLICSDPKDTVVNLNCCSAFSSNVNQLNGNGENRTRRIFNINCCSIDGKNSNLKYPFDENDEDKINTIDGQKININFVPTNGEMNVQIKTHERITVDQLLRQYLKKIRIHENIIVNRIKFTYLEKPLLFDDYTTLKDFFNCSDNRSVEHNFEVKVVIS